MYLNLFGRGVLFLNTLDADADLLEKRGPIYSDKPRMVMCAELYVFSRSQNQCFSLILVHCHWQVRL